MKTVAVLLWIVLFISGAVAQVENRLTPYNTSPRPTDFDIGFVSTTEKGARCDNIYVEAGGSGKAGSTTFSGGLTEFSQADVAKTIDIIGAGLPITFTATTTVGSASLAFGSDPGGVMRALPVTGQGLPAGITIVSVQGSPGAYTALLSAKAIGSGTGLFSVPGVLETSITSVSGSSAILGARLLSSVSGVAFYYGHDDTSAFQAALDTDRDVYAPRLAGLCRVASVEMRHPGQRIRGDGRNRTKIFTMYPTNAQGTIVFSILSPHVQGPEVEDLGLYYYQPDDGTNVPAGKIHYSAAIYARGVQRSQLRHIGIYDAWTQVDLRSFGTSEDLMRQAGGTTIDDLQGSAWGHGLWIDKNLDAILIHNYFWNGFTGNPNGGDNYGYFHNILPWAYFAKDGATVALDCGSCSDITVSDSLILGGLAFRANGSGFGTFSNVDSDSFQAIVCAGVNNFSWNGGAITVGTDTVANKTSPKFTAAEFDSGCTFSFNGTLFNFFEYDADQAFFYINRSSAVSINAPTAILMNGFDNSFAVVDGGTLVLNGAASISRSPTTHAKFSGEINGTKLTVTRLISGMIVVGQTLNGPGISVGTVVLANVTGLGGAGEYIVNKSQTVVGKEISGAGTTYSRSLIQVVSGNVIVGSNNFIPGGWAFNKLIGFENDGENRVVGNSGPGWLVGCPGGKTVSLHSSGCQNMPLSSFVGN